MSCEGVESRECAVDVLRMNSLVWIFSGCLEDEYHIVIIIIRVVRSKMAQYENIK